MLLQLSVAANSIVWMERWKFLLVVTKLGSLPCNSRMVPKLKASERKVKAGVTNIFAYCLERQDGSEG